MFKGIEKGRSIKDVLFEAIIIGIVLAALFYGISKIAGQSLWVLVLTGALVHLLFEYSPWGNINKKWCKVILNN